MAKYKDILGNERVYEDSTVTISIERYNELIIKEAIADCLAETKEQDKSTSKAKKEN